ncbi:aminopeptidase [Clostridium senegalense]|uniref:aminopeptidase n=1 Tax=Clostridium senegalense TaxID=1465809 RepID=UPI0002899491|nr:aminopeptidase [Clostridium senegalense]
MEFKFDKENYNFTVKEISEIANKQYKEEPKKFIKFLQSQARFASKMCNLEKQLDNNYFNKPFEELLKDNHKLYEDIIGERYNTSFCNPVYAVKVFGEELGKIATFLYNISKKYITYAFSHNLKMMHFYNEHFLSIYNFVEYNNNENPEDIKALLKELNLNNQEFLCKHNLKDKLINKESHVKNIIETSNLDDLRYLFKYGYYISDNEIKTAEFLNKYENIDLIADTVCNGYIEGFKRDNKDYNNKSTSRIFANVGQERIIKLLIERLRRYSLEPIIDQLVYTSPNKQFDYDHRFDIGLFYDEEIGQSKLKANEKLFEKYKKELKQYSGILYFEKFGETPFAPESKKEALKLNEKQGKIYQKYQSAMAIKQDKYIPMSEVSFTIIAFPTPEIGENFEEIFEDTLKINLLDSKQYEKIQKRIIDVLDKGDYIHIKGFGNNKTDIKVKMHEIKNPEKETNFENCVADVNIPVGEVFTSPVLKGTNGLLHVEEVYLGDLKYKNLSLTFKDGYVEEYSCTNFLDEEENKKYIEENLLFPHKTLPLGEFAIGTNTLAYVISKKHQIVNILPILIVEKMGPHFAIGDTCFSQCEDVKVYNSDRKEIIARDNEKSILRKTDIENAYTSCHTDITLPYDDIELISVITKEGKSIDIIRDGRFVVEGTEELNRPLEN